MKIKPEETLNKRKRSLVRQNTDDDGKNYDYSCSLNNTMLLRREGVTFEKSDCIILKKFDIKIRDT